MLIICFIYVQNYYIIIIIIISIIIISTTNINTHIKINVELQIKHVQNSVLTDKSWIDENSSNFEF